MANDELGAMQIIAGAVEPLTEAERKRVISWVIDRFEINGLERIGSKLNQSRTAPAEERIDFGSFAELFDAANPKLEKEKALLAAYWVQICQAHENFGSQALNTELKNLGHGILNITDALSQLISDKPALILQLKKGGSSKQARKTYKITEAGIRWVRSKTSQGEAE